MVVEKCFDMIFYIMKKFEDVCYTFVHGKNAKWNRHVQYILIEKPLKIKLIIVYCLPRVRLVTF